jgi:PAS domain S-box-containing protein
MKDELGFSDVKRNLEDSKQNPKGKQVYLPYDIELLSILKDAVIITDKNFIINYWNPAAEEIYGWNANEVLGKDVKKVLQTKYIENGSKEKMQELLNEGSYEDNVVQLTKKNFPLFISSKVVTIKDDHGNINGYVSINRDMTDQKSIEKKLERSFNILNSIVENTTDAIYLKNLDGNYLMANSSASKIFGKPMAEIIGHTDWDIFPQDEAKSIVKSDKEIINDGNTVTFEEKIFSQLEGKFRTYLSTKGPYKGYDNKILGIFGIARDITHFKVSEENYRTLFETMIQGVVYQDLNGKITAMNPAAERIMGYNFEEIQGRTSNDPMWKSIHPDGTEFQGDEHPSMVALKTGREVEDVIMGVDYPNIEGYTWLNIHAVPHFRNGEKKPFQVYTTFEDITQFRIYDQKLRDNKKRYQSLFNKMTEGFALHEIILNQEGKPVDYRFLDINPAFEELTGLKKEDVIGKLKSQVIPDDNVDWVKIYGDVAIKGESIQFDSYSATLDRHYDILSFSPAQNQFAVLFTDITERKNVEKKLQDTMENLMLTNSELEQFTYVAAHDLQEPLRMIACFLQLLQKRYGNKLDKDADDFIEYAVDGAARMYELINDLLTYSRLNNRVIEFSDVDMNHILGMVKHNLEILIRENDAVITSDKLPVVKADEVQMVQLLQNLIANSIKFRGNKTPHIHITAEKLDSKWLFSFEDNGIGIKPEYRERIFKIFQRLHGPEKYDGTGIGLAISKRIVERHGGTICLVSKEDEGSKFNFTIRS